MQNTKFFLIEELKMMDGRLCGEELWCPEKKGKENRWLRVGDTIKVHAARGSEYHNDAPFCLQ